MKKHHSESKEKPHPMLHGQHDGKMPHMSYKAHKEPEGHKMGADHHHKEINKHLKHLHSMAKKGHK